MGPAVASALLMLLISIAPVQVNGQDPVECAQNYWPCSDGRQCIHMDYQCDGDNDCDDASDENLDHCNEFQCFDDYFSCVSNRRARATPYCILEEWVCDGDEDCKDGEDERNCTTGSGSGDGDGWEPPLQCESDQFKCPENYCIPKSQLCDVKYDCIGGADERECVYRTCGPDEFTCSDGSCVSLSGICDKSRDCRDGSDEDPTICLAPATCSPRDFKCDNGVCVSLATAMCDANDDCGDNSDERPELCNNVGRKECATQTLNNCQQKCVEQTFGFRCECNSGYRLKADGANCEDIDECLEVIGACQQTCANSKGSYTCSCVDGYTLLPDTRRCTKNDNIKPRLIFGNKYYIRTVDTDGQNYGRLNSEHEYTHVLDYHYTQGKVYFADAYPKRPTKKKKVPTATLR